VLLQLQSVQQLEGLLIHQAHTVPALCTHNTQKTNANYSRHAYKAQRSTLDSTNLPASRPDRQRQPGKQTDIRPARAEQRRIREASGHTDRR
jgi:hypothetical protein